jgi:WS/DGAT C-terminal domain
MAGAPMLELFPVVSITANISIGVGALSYADQFSITVAADRQLCPTWRPSSMVSAVHSTSSLDQS